MEAMESARFVVAEQFQEPAQQKEAATLGMWVFLSTEVLFFGGMLMAYSGYRFYYPAAWSDAAELMEKTIGTINTGILLTSSLTVALAVRYAKLGAKRPLLWCLGLTALFGIAFNGLKLYEYADHVHNHLLPGVDFQASLANMPVGRLFFTFYYVMTGIHALHVLIGIGLFTSLFFLVAQDRYLGPHSLPIEVIALYWHFVDLVWIFLYPLFYFPGGG